MASRAKRQWPFWEIALVVAIFAAGAWSSTLSPYYLSVDQLFSSTRAFIIPGLLALGLAVVVSFGEIDISLASTLAVGTVALSKFSAAGAPLCVAAPIVVAICARSAAHSTASWSPSGVCRRLAVTLGTMGAFRGLAFIVGSEVGYTDFNDAYSWSGRNIFSAASCRRRSSSSPSRRLRCGS